MLMKSLQLNLMFVVAVAVCLCGCSNKAKNLTEGSTAQEGYEDSEVHAIQQALPSIMVIPSDNLLEEYGALKTEKQEGRNYVLRDYQKYLLANNSNPLVVSTVQDFFVKQNYPLNDLEQTLKQLNTQEATDMADGLEKDSKTLLLTTASPDIILELDYRSKLDLASHNVKERMVDYTLRAIDTYTNKVIATASNSGMQGESEVELIKNDLTKRMDDLSGDIQNYFSDILTRGREVTVRITVVKGSNTHLSDTNVEGDTYADWMMDYVKTNTVKGAYKLQRNTNEELYFINVRIPLLNDDGTQYGVYDWTRDFCKSIRKNLGVKATNKAQGLGEIQITIEGL